MNTDQPITIPEGSLESLDLNEQLSGITSSLTEMLAPFILLSFVITAVFIVLHIVSMIRRRKLENALFDIQKTLHEMNERDKVHAAPMPNPPRPQNRTETIAASEQREEHPSTNT